MEENNQNLDTRIQEGNTGQELPYHTHNGVDSPIINVSEASLILADVTTGDATTSRHGFLPKLSGASTEFLDGTGDYDTVKDSDLSTSDITTNDVSTTKHGFVPKAPNDTSKFLRGDGTWNSLASMMTGTAGETLTAGEVVNIQLSTGNNASQGYNWSGTGNPYICRAAANNTTYGDHVLGVVESAATYLGSVNILLGGISTHSGLTAGSRYYLSDYTGTSAESITQTQQDAEFNVTTTHILEQIFIPTSSRLDKVIFYARKDGGGACNMTVEVRRVNAILATISVDLGANSASLAEKTFDFSDVRTYKGELLKFRITVDTDFAYLGYKSGGDVYAPVYGPTGSASGLDLILVGGSGTIASGSDAYMKVYEYPNFGTIGTTAGTRTMKIGQAHSTTALAFILQYGDSIL